MYKNLSKLSDEKKPSDKDLGRMGQCQNAASHVLFLNIKLQGKKEIWYCSVIICHKALHTFLGLTEGTTRRKTCE